MKEKELRRLRPRAILFFWMVAIIAAALIARLYYVQVREGASLAAYAGQEQRATFAVTSQRGDIVDRFDVPLATTIPAASIFVQPSEVDDAPAEAAKLAKLLHRHPAELVSALTAKTAFSYLARGVPKSIADKIAKLELRGIGVEQAPTGLRATPQAAAGSTIIGFTGVDNQGLAGIEYSFNAVLAGRPGKVIEETDSAGKPIPFGRRVITPAVVGDTVVLTIDSTLQYAADQILAQTVKAHQAADGAAIIMRAKTGEILALANYPNFDPARFYAYPPSAWRDRAITDPFEPGSTFKLVTSTAALDSGKVGLDDTFRALDRIEVGGYPINNADDGQLASGHSYETLGDIVAFSHNVGAAQIALRVGKKTMYDYIRRFGFDAPTGIDLPGESSGIIGTPDEWWGSRLATIGFGQGVSVTALQLARAYGAIANGGMLMRPLIVREIIAPNGRVVKKYSPQAIGRVMLPGTAAELLAIMRDVVRRGTGANASIPGYAVAGKTGTAQMVINGAYIPGAYTASFIGIVPADKPQYVILINIHQPRGAYYGGVVAAPAFKQLAARVLWRERILPRNAGNEQGQQTSYDFLIPPVGESWPRSTPARPLQLPAASALQGNATSPW